MMNQLNFLEHVCNGRDISLDNYVYVNAVLAAVKSSDYIIANKIRTKCIHQMKRILKQFDFIATPTSGAFPTSINEDDHICTFHYPIRRKPSQKWPVSCEALIGWPVLIARFNLHAIFSWFPLIGCLNMPYKMLNRWRDQHFRVITSLLVLEASQLYRDSGNKRPDRETRPTANGDSVYDAVGKNLFMNSW